MANPQETLETIGRIDGHLGSCIVDCESGEMLASEGSDFDLELAAAAHVEVVRAKHRAMRCLGLDEQIEDILITLETQYHLIRIVAKHPSLFLFVLLDRKQGNLAMARHVLARAEEGMEVAPWSEQSRREAAEGAGRLRLVQH